MRRILRISVSLAASVVVGFFLLLAASLHGFYALTDETLIAEIEFDRADEQFFLAHLRTGNFCSEQVYAVFGDQWRIDAQFLKWRYWASLLGFESRYRLERLEGRYQDASEQNLRPTRAHALAAPSAIDIGGLSGRLGRFNFLADASYGSSTYHDVNPDLVYLVYKSPTGIFTRTRPRATPQARGELLNVEVRRGCDEPEGALGAAAAWINRTVDREDSN
jgi:hypothetical protein